VQNLPSNMTDTMSFLPTYNAPPEQHREYLRQSLPLMIRNNIPTDPINYAIWYEYVTGNNLQLNQEVDTLIRDKKTFDPETSLNLYKTHICNASAESFEKIHHQLRQLIEQTVLAVNLASEKASVAGDHLTVNSQTLQTTEAPTDLRVILAEIIQETRQLAEASNTLKAQLNETHKEMELLRNELAQVREIAKTDALTGLLNRRAFDNALAAFVASPTCQHGCLALLDLDHFKQVNDSHGHLVGDKVLRFFASLLKKYTAGHHHAARYGGEEMAIIMPDTVLTEALDIIDHIRKIMESTRLTRKDNTETIGKVTVSSGIAILRVGDTMESIIDRADAALYRAKETGRNKIVVENTP
jgi:diguanylate cyclase